MAVDRPQADLCPFSLAVCTMAEPPPDQATSAPPSAKALGKRPAALAAALDSPALSSSDGKAANSPVAKAKEREKRVTRSSLGGAGSSGGPLSREGSAAASEGELSLVCRANCSSSEGLLTSCSTRAQP